MKCPKCELEMEEAYKERETEDRKGKKYIRRVYWCRDDDIWVSVEVPKDAK